LWLALALPNLQLLPGLGDLQDGRIAISLQSAVMGIDDGAGRPPLGDALAAAHALGLTGPGRLPATSHNHAGPLGGPILVDLRPAAAAADRPAPTLVSTARPGRSRSQPPAAPAGAEGVDQRPVPPS